MEFIFNTSQIEKMNDNKIIGLPKLIDSKINFRGKNNILVCDNNIELNNVILDFNGDNTIVYLGSDLNNNFQLVVYNNSTVFIGKNTKIGKFVSFKVYESQNLFIGEDCIINDNITITTSDSCPIYNNISKKRINFSNSVYIGDHVLIGDYAFISNGVKIGSGAIIDNKSVIIPNAIIPSNTLSSGNPSKIIKQEIFFTNDSLKSYKSEDTINSENYKSEVFIYSIDIHETISTEKIEKILGELDVISRLDFIQKLFIQNKRKNRFSL